jgi:hypothetical protein
MILLTLTVAGRTISVSRNQLVPRRRHGSRAIDEEPLGRALQISCIMVRITLLFHMTPNALKQDIEQLNDA